MSANQAWDALPSYLRGGLGRYLIHGVEPGGFLSAVIENDLNGAIARGSTESLASLKALVTFLYNYAPADAWGFKNAVAEWRQLPQGLRVRLVRDSAGSAFAPLADASGVKVEA